MKISLSEELRKEIQRRIEEGERIEKIAADFKVSVAWIYSHFNVNRRQRRKERLKKQVMELKALGMTNKEIAKILGISEVSVRKYIRLGGEDEVIKNVKR